MRASSSGHGLRRTSVLFAGISVLLVGIGLTPASADTLTFNADTPGTLGAIGTAYSYTYTSSASDARYGVYSGTLPTGLTLDPDTGVLSGTPTRSGNYSFAVQVNSATDNATADGDLNTIVVSGPGSAFIADTGDQRLLEELPGPGAGSPVLITGVQSPQRIAVDPAGDVFATGSGSPVVTELPADGRGLITVTADKVAAPPTGIAVDSSGDLFTASAGNPGIVETTPAGVTIQNLGAGSFSTAQGISTDAAGNLYVTSEDDGRIVEIPAAAPRTPVVVASGLTDPVDVAVDSAGDHLWVAEGHPNDVQSIPVSTGVATQIISGLRGPSQIGLDGNGNIVVADLDAAYRYPDTGGAQTTLASSFTSTSVDNPLGIAALTQPLSFVAQTPPQFATVGTSFDYQYTASSASATFSVADGSLPDGLTLDPDGDLHGTPSGTGSFSFTVVASTGLGGIVSPVTITVNNAGSGVTALTIFYAVPSSEGFSFEVGGLLVGEPNTHYDGDEGDPSKIAIDAQGSCNDEGATVDTFSVTTDAHGVAYFAQEIDTDPLVFVPHLADYSFFGNCYPVGPDNTGWSNASQITLQNGVGTGTGEIALPGESRWYKFTVTPDSSVTVTLSGLTNDDALAVYGDIGSAYANPGTTPLDEQAAEQPGSSFSPSAFSPSAFSPSAFSPSAFSPSAFSPSAFSPSAFSPSAFSPSAFSPSAFSPSAFSPSAFSPSAFSPSAFSPSAFSPSAFSAAGFTPSAFSTSSYSPVVGNNLIGFSDDNGNADKTVTVNTWSNTGSFYVAVAGRDGSTAPDVPFTVTVNDGSGSCAPGVVPSSSPAPGNVAAGNVKTVLLTDTSRVAGSASDKSFMLSQLQAVAARPEVAGTVIDLASNSRVQGLQTQADANPNCPFAENLVAGAIKDIVNSYRANNPLTYVVLAGGDSTIPFFRHPDQTLIGNESGYVPPLADQTAAQAALRLGYVLSDNDYGAKTTLVSKSDSYPVPDLAVGRLVESASEISGQLTNYLATNGGVVATPKSSLVTGYDFLALPANQVESNLTAGIGTGAGTTNDTLIQPDGDSPASSWNGTQLATKLLNSGRHDVVFLSGHFSANDTLAADYATDVITTQMEQSSVNLTNSLVFSPGCHSGYNIPDTEALPGVTLTLDWPQEFARKGAIFVGGTGYQYGDTDFVAYSEQIDANLSHNLLLGTGAVSIGQALLKAKQDYLTSQSSLGAIPQKAVLEAEMYGLPMESINMPNGRIPTPTTTASGITPTGSTTAPGNQLGLSSADVTVTSHLSSVQSKRLTDITTPGSPSVTATYYTGGSGVSTNPYEPVLPLESKNVTVPGNSVRGVLFLGGHYSDESGVTPLVSAPTTETGAVHTGFSSNVYYPQQPYSVNQLGALDGTSSGGTTLFVTPAQHISDPSGGTDTRRTYTDTSYRVFYLGNGSTVAKSAAPTVVAVNAQLDPNDSSAVDVCADLGGNPAAGIQEAVVTWSDASKTSGQWQSSDLTAGSCDDNFGDAGGFGGTVSLGDTTAANLRFMVQAVNGVGLVTLNNNLGAYFSLPNADQNFPYRTSTITKFTATTSNAPYGTSETLTAALNDDNEDSNPPTITPIAGETLTFQLGTKTATAVTGDDGVATATFPLDIAPGTYTPSAAFGGNDDDNPSSGQGAPVTVTKQVSHLDVAVTSGTPAVGDTSYTVTLCSTSGSSCGTTDPLLIQKSVIMQLTGPVSRTTSIQTGGAGQARFDAYGLPTGRYTLTATFGAVPNLTTQSDEFFNDASATTTFNIATSFTTPPTLTVPTSVTVPKTSAAGAIVSFTVSASDPVDPRPVVACSPGSVSLFPVGTTEVDCTATDSGGRSATASFPVTVTDGALGQVAITPVAQTKVYGTADPAFTYTTSGLPDGVSLSAAPTCSASSEAGVGSSPITCSGAVAPTGYTVAYAPASLVVTPATVAVTPSSQSKVFGSAEPPVSYTTGGYVGPDSAASVFSTPPSCSAPGDVNVGTYPISCTAGVLNSAAGANYKVDTTATATMTVTAAPVTVTATSLAKVYDGKAVTSFPFTTSGFVSKDGFLTAPTCALATGTGISVGTYSITCKGGTVGANYQLGSGSYVTGQLVISAKAGVVVPVAHSIVYGHADPTFTYTVDGLAPGVDQAGTVTPGVSCGVSGTVPAGTFRVVGTYPITCKGPATAGNYTLTYPTTPAVLLTVTGAPLTVTAANQSRVYGGRDPALTEVVSGLVGADKLTTGPTCTVVAHTAVGSYPITCAGAKAGSNYLSTITYVPGKLVVTPASLTITPTLVATVYGSAAPPVPVPLVRGLTNGDVVASLGKALTCKANTTAATNAGIQKNLSTCAGAVDANYAISYVSGIVLVLRAPTVLTEQPVIVTGTSQHLQLQYSATLVSTVTGKGIAGQTVLLGSYQNASTGSASCTAVTSATGVATCASAVLKIPKVVASGYETANYYGSSNYRSSSLISRYAVKT